MSWTTKVDNTTARDSVISTITTAFASITEEDEVTVSRSDFTSFFDGTETVQDCIDFAKDQIASTHGFSIQSDTLDLADDESVLRIKSIPPK